MSAELARAAAEEIVAILERLDEAGIPVHGVDASLPDPNVVIGDPDKKGHVQVRRHGSGQWIWDYECCHWYDDRKSETVREWRVTWHEDAVSCERFFDDEDSARDKLDELGLSDDALSWRDVTAQPWRRAVTGHGETT